MLLYYFLSNVNICFQSTLPGRKYNRDIILPYCKIYTLFKKKNDCALSVKSSTSVILKWSALNYTRKKLLKSFHLEIFPLLNQRMINNTSERRSLVQGLFVRPHVQWAQICKRQFQLL